MIGVDGIRQMIESAVGPWRARVRGLVRRAVIDVLDNGPGLATASMALTDDDTDVADGVEIITPIGVSSRPGKGTQAIVLAVGGNAGHRVAIPVIRGQRLTGDDIDEGEVALYVGAAGQVVHLKADGSVVVRAADVGEGEGGSIVLKANGDVVATAADGAGVYLGDGAATKKVSLVDELNSLRDAFNSHTHPTAPPGVVSTPTPVPLVIPVPLFTGATNVYGKG